MGNTTKRWVRIACAAAVLMSVAATAPAGAYGILHGSRDLALLNFFEAERSLAVYMDVTAWGTTYYWGVPPEEQGGLGDAVVCLAFYLPNPETGDVHAHGCADGLNFAFDRLQSLHVEDSIEVELTDGDDEFAGTETVVVDLTLTGTGLPFPGTRAQLNPSPGIEVEASFLRDATVAGTLSSPQLGTVDLADASAVLATDTCVGFMVGEDNIEACRF